MSARGNILYLNASSKCLLLWLQIFRPGDSKKAIVISCPEPLDAHLIQVLCIVRLTISCLVTTHYVDWLITYATPHKTSHKGGIRRLFSIQVFQRQL